MNELNLGLYLLLDLLYKGGTSATLLSDTFCILLLGDSPVSPLIRLGGRDLFFLSGVLSDCKHTRKGVTDAK